jgi:hypothetical protein
MRQLRRDGGAAQAVGYADGRRSQPEAAVGLPVLPGLPTAQVAERAGISRDTLRTATATLS